MRAAVCLLLAACGRIGFDPFGGDDTPADVPPVLPGLVARYLMEDDPGDGAIDDSSGNGHTAGCVVGSTCPTSAPGKRGNAMAFNGTTQALRVPDHPAFHMIRAYTITAWVLLDQVTEFHAVVGKACEAATENSFNLFVSATQGTCIEWFGTNGPNARCTSDAPIIGRWVHVAQLYNGGEMALYIDGVRAVAAGLSEDIRYDDHPITIGADEDNGVVKVFWDGRIDEVHIFDRVLTIEELADLAAP